VNSGEPGLTILLQQWGSGDSAAAEKVIPLIYQDLRGLCRSYLNRERAGHTLQSTALIHEVYLRLLEQHSPGWTNRAEFLGSVGVLIHRILVDYARTRNAEKRGDGLRHLPLDSVRALSKAGTREITALADALADLASFDSQKARVVELRFFVGLTMEEVAEVLGISLRSAQREWLVAKSWLQSYLAVPA
jgi:RNA polymerase sigma factor (TIGR02999 family)